MPTKERIVLTIALTLTRSQHIDQIMLQPVN
uniref:Uncharacterized protein n=1 Tax=Rhizophora mucronata TaxID=61149 RepID=A0A2P2LAA6_RHIMU